MKRDIFSGYHPFVNILYFALVIGCGMVFTHPVCQGISLFCAVIYSLNLNSKKALRFQILYMLPLLIATALVNPVFSHQGVTILTYLPSGNPLTLESILYGVSAAFLLITAVTWFSCFNAVMSSDKFVYLFGRVAPALSLLLALTLRFVPRFRAQVRVISAAQRCVGRDVSNGGVLKRAKHGIRILSILITWALENAIETADSMRSRGYGLPGRTAFSIYRFERRDGLALAFLSLCGGLVVAGGALGALKFIYYPMLGGAQATVWQGGLFAVYFALCAMPVVINCKEELRWKSIRQAQASSLKT